ncbi:MAG: bifunctional oligoribonuclease/PAP phosphatase NrnA [Fimbriimonadaceae bacterium]|nr:bifunctional oligoribonuclease/PAP phosphatase NrnA [Fimbriimonadaceae bacterium]
MSQTITLAKKFQAEVQKASSVLIGTHLNPDGDALGSALAVSHYLDALGVQNEIVCHHAPPQNLLFLPGVGRVRQEPENEKHDLGIILDLDSTERLGSTAPFFDHCFKLIVVDHHVPHEAPGDFRIIDVEAAATALILTRLFKELDADVTPEMATCLLTGIVTDTGSFRFRNTSPEALHLSGFLLECGADINLVSEEIFHRKRFSAARLQGYMLEKMVLECDEQLAWAPLTLRDFESAGSSDEDTEGFVNELLSIRTVQIAALFREHKPNRVRVSLRSRAEYDVAEVGREFGGGGHKNAAGCSFESSIDEVIDAVIPRLRACLGYS